MGRFFVSIFLAMMLVLPAASPARAQSSELPICRDDHSLSETRSKLGGMYIADGSSQGFIDTLNLHAVSNQIQGTYTSIQHVAGTEYLRENYSVSGLFDDESISIEIKALLSPTVMMGTWSERGIYLEFTKGDGTVGQTFFDPIDDTTAEMALDTWPNHWGRDNAFDYLVTKTQPVFDGSPFEISEPQRLFEDQVVRGEEPLSPLEVLVQGWKASVQHYEKSPDTLPNQMNWYITSVFNTREQAQSFGGCHIERTWHEGEISVVDGPPGATIYTNTLTNEGEVIITQVVMVHENKVVSVDLYGDEDMTKHGIEMMNALAESFGLLR